MKNTPTIILTVIILLLAVAGGVYAYKIWIVPAMNRSNTEDNGQLIGGQKDEHGCLIAAGYSWCEAKQKCLRFWEEGCDDQIYSLIEDVKKETGVDFVKKGEAAIKWNYEGEEKTESLNIQGKEFSADGLNESQYQDVENFLETSGFEADPLNISAGVVGALTGYQRKNMVCLLSYQMSDFDENNPQYIPTPQSKKNAEIKCGFLEPDSIPELSLEKQIQKLFAQKYNKKVSEIQINITKETKNYARGGVLFSPGGPGEGGYFFVYKKDEEWNIAADGNGSVSCRYLKYYGFPDDMTEDFCYNSQTPNDFSETGNLTLKGEEGGIERWALVYEKPGQPALSVDLFFTQDSFCDFGSGAEPCLEPQFEQGQRAEVQGQSGAPGNVMVSDLFVIK
jgi:hypothetical protein